MNKSWTLSLSLAFICISAFAIGGDKYQYSLDLTQVKDDKLMVKLIPPDLPQGDALFRLPKIVPGTYSIYDFGRFASDFTVTPKKGQKCDVTIVDANTWKISNASQIEEITYWVEDSWDASDRSNWVFEPAGTNIEEGKNFVLNNHGFFGYFEGLTKRPYEVKITHPAGFYGSTGLEFTSTGNTDVFAIPNYNVLVDSPIMYNQPDTTFIRVGNARVLISVHNESHQITSAFIAKNVQEMLEAQKEYLGGRLPVDKYAFIIYLPTSFTSFGYGALEHSNSSMYYLPAFGEDYLAGMVKDIASHEFFHILTPLTIHSEEIGNFDFTNPKMSQHLWMYEGCTEYAAHHMQVKYKLTTMDQFLSTIQEKIGQAASFNDTLPFTVMSKGCLDVYKDQYLNVYQKGALIGMCLDLKLLKLSGGSMGLQDLMRKLSGRFGKEQSFKDDELFGVITELTYPEIGEFFKRYVAGPEPLPLAEVLDYAGIAFTEGGTREVLDIGIDFKNVGYDEANKQFYVMSADELSDVGKAFGFKSGDVIQKINGKEMNLENLVVIVTEVFEKLKPADTLEYEIGRPGKKGKLKKVKLKSRVGTRTAVVEDGLMPLDEPSAEQLKIRKAWINQ